MEIIGVNIYDIYYLPENEIERLINSFSSEDILRVFGVHSAGLNQFLKVDRWLYELNLQEHIVKRNKSYNEFQIKTSEDRLVETLQIFSKNHEIQIIEDLIYFTEEEILLLINLASEDVLTKSFITMPDAIINHVNHSLSKLQKPKEFNKTPLCGMNSLIEIQSSQNEILGLMKVIRKKTIKE